MRKTKYVHFREAASQHGLLLWITALAETPIASIRPDVQCGLKAVICVYVNLIRRLA